MSSKTWDLMYSITAIIIVWAIFLYIADKKDGKNILWLLGIPYLLQS